jgi:hypothetical protein
LAGLVLACSEPDRSAVPLNTGNVTNGKASPGKRLKPFSLEIAVVEKRESVPNGS